ncbi:DNA repair helicase RHP51 [Ceratobasidium sp. AG-Ba]|nr:DNA repair helicase RHP51 [Ceratobasidium sp. AG-Ba]
MDLPTTAQIPELSDQTRTLLAKGPNLKNYIDIVTLSASDLATKLHVPLERAQTVLKHVHAAYAPVTTLVDLENSDDLTAEEISGRTFTTGDEGLDNLLGGGIVVGQITEITGEAAGGKSQLALQLSFTLFDYVESSQHLSPSRYDQGASHSRQPPSSDSHSRYISTQHASDVDKLTVLLASLLPTHITACQARGTPLRLLVIDSLTAVFRDNTANRQASQSLYARSESLNAIGSLLQQIASTHGIAVVAINDVTDVFAPNPGSNTDSEELIYREQSRWFARAGGVAGEERHEAALGMDLTGAYWTKTTPWTPTSIRRGPDEDAVLIRRVFFLFGKSVEDEVPAPSLDFIVCAQGVKTVL